tara:strand:+ start:42275 stop:46411 length:4137 start_codon:yes stop_codon:yes gene_type:complete
MAEVVDRYQPTFSLFPINTNRTGYQPVNLPLVLVVPFRRTIDGIPINDTGLTDCAFYIEDAPGKVPVAGVQNQGIFVPNFERFRREVSTEELSSVKIDVTGQRFFDPATGDEKTYSDVNNGDLMEITLMRGVIGAFGRSGPGSKDRIPYYYDADYYDVTPFIIETVDLPEGKYNFVWECSYYKRIISSNGELVCIDTSRAIKSRFSSYINHPGDLHFAMIRRSPALYFNSPSIDKDGTVAFYRPFADALQDIFDEQELLRGVNWIDKIPVQYIPYLANLIGLDLPYFPSTTDQVRRSMLRNGRKLQQLKGSKRAIRELFDIFGFTIDVANLWFSKDGQRFIAPDEQLPSDIEDQEITTETLCVSEPLIADYSSPGFGQLTVPLLFKALGNITLDAYFVTRGTPQEIALQNALDATATDVESFSTGRCSLTPEGFQLSDFQESIAVGSIGHSTVLISQDVGGIDETQRGIPVVSTEGIGFNPDTNEVSLDLDHYFSFDRDTVVYVFATYERTKIVLPTALADLRSNRFDINILLFKNGEQPTSDVYEFLLEFLFKFKAFHSLLRKITFTVECPEIYNVQDFCVGGRLAQDADSDLGNIQIPPPVIPNDIPDLDDPDFVCSEFSLDRGFKGSDTDHRDEILDLLEQEHAAWKNLDGTHEVPDALLPILQSASRIQIRQPDGDSCQFNPFGQDRIVSNGEKDFDHFEDDRAKLCDVENNVADYCYKGRVEQVAETELTMILPESWRCRPCDLMPGLGLYYLTPLIQNDEFSCGDQGPNAPDLTNIANYRRSGHDQGYTRVMAFSNPELHYTDRAYVDDIEDTINNRFFATRRPSLEIDKDNMFYPGHRFVSMANLISDLNHPEYRLRPWDYVFNYDCPEDVPSGLTVPEINARIEIGTDGEEVIAYDDADLIYVGNGIAADIPNMDVHDGSLIPQNDVTHSVWSSADPGLCYSTGFSLGSQPVYAIDHKSDALRFSEEALGEQKNFICFTDLQDPIFESADRNCPCPEGDDVWTAQDLENIETTGADPTAITGGVTPTGGADFIDGYPAEFGSYMEDLTDFDFPRETIEGYGFSLYDEDLYSAEGGITILGPAIALGLPLIVTGEGAPSLRFRLGSGVRVRPGDFDYEDYRPHRMDCGCTSFECPDDSGGTGTGTSADVTAEPETLTIERCHLSHFELPDGSYDFNCDRVDLISTMILDEQYRAQTCIMDGAINNMMMFEDEKEVFSGPLTDFDERFPQEGSFKFIDDYGIIYRVIFETFNDRLDYTLQVQDPRVPGQEISGEVINRRVFKDGVETVERQIIQVTDQGFMVLAEGGSQEIKRFQTTFGCGDETFNNPFAFFLDNNIVDDIAFEIRNVTSGTVTVDDDFGGEDFGGGGFGGS